MKLLVLGAGDLGLGILKGLVGSDHQIVGVLPWESLNKLKGPRALVVKVKRRLIPDMSGFALSQRWPMLTPASANSEAFSGQVRALAPDVIVVAGWGEVLRAEALALPARLVLNCHPSLLPMHRGADPAGSVLRAGEARTGISFHQMTPTLDAGPVLLQSEFPIASSDDHASLSRKLSQRAAETIVDALAQVAAGEPGMVQNDALASYWRRGSLVERQLDWRRPAESVVRQVRAAHPGSPAFTHHGGHRLDVLAAETGQYVGAGKAPGEIVFQAGTAICVAVAAPGHAVWLTRLSCGKGGTAQGRIYSIRNLKPGVILN